MFFVYIWMNFCNVPSDTQYDDCIFLDFYTIIKLITKLYIYHLQFSNMVLGTLHGSIHK